MLDTWLRYYTPTLLHFERGPGIYNPRLPATCDHRTEDLGIANDDGIIIACCTRCGLQARVIMPAVRMEAGR